MPDAINPIEDIKQKTDLCWFIAMETDRFLSGPMADIDKVDLAKLMEMRAFCEAYEIKAFRADLSSDFAIRDSRELDAEIADESEVISKTTEQFLDIDEKRSGGASSESVRKVFATGGGAYTLPINATKMEIVNYYRADDVGFYKATDFRIVRFL
jgi:hypothetical protein